MSKSKPKPKPESKPGTAQGATPKHIPAGKPASGYKPVGKVKVLAESATERVLMDDLRVWKEPVH